METCIVSILGGDGQTHVLEVEASSLFEAVGEAAHQWSMLWWWAQHSAVVEVRAKGHSWRVSVEQVRQWQQSQRRKAGKA